MARRIEAGPLVVALGAVLLLVSLFLDWFTPGLDAWTVFEALDLVLAALALGALVAALGLIAPEVGKLDRRWLAPLSIAAVVVVGSQIANPPPAAGEGDPDSGAWVALAGSLLMAAGALLSFSRVKLSFTVEGRDPRQRVAAVDARQPGASSPAPGGAGAVRPADQTATERIDPAVPPGEPGGGPRAFAGRAEARGGRAPHVPHTPPGTPPAAYAPDRVTPSPAPPPPPRASPSHGAAPIGSRAPQPGSPRGPQPAPPRASQPGPPRGPSSGAGGAGGYGPPYDR